MARRVRTVCACGSPGQVFVDCYARAIRIPAVARALEAYSVALTAPLRLVLRLASWRRPARVLHDDAGVTYVAPHGEQVTIRWAALDEVRILTTDDGPFASDFFWVLLSRSGERPCLVPNDAEGAEGLLARLQGLPGFDNDAVLRAAGSTAFAEFRCWSRGP